MNGNLQQARTRLTWAVGQWTPAGAPDAGENAADGTPAPMHGADLMPGNFRGLSDPREKTVGTRV